MSGGGGAMRLAEMTREQAGQVAGECVLVVPIGSTEQHGPHLPAGTDALHAEWVAWRAAEVASVDVPVVVAPTLAYGCSEHHLPFGADDPGSGDADTGRRLLEVAAAAVARAFVGLHDAATRAGPPGVQG
jgi:creatinine amidohydrolase